jgi:hypothetical protein
MGCLKTSAAMVEYAVPPVTDTAEPRQREMGAAGSLRTEELDVWSLRCSAELIEVRRRACLTDLSAGQCALYLRVWPVSWPSGCA